ncbi:hypothetical protein ACFOW6_07950 [Fodinicurvata halophila]|uniref:Nucleotide-diphospho-sugar transferase domain-containing protein n=1 Tax=Fodinicurvata halophila TaxID=1419723 RepID=A0ABV8UJL8_9PROT
MKTVVFQSHREADRPEWIDLCMQSVRDWAETRGHVYRFYGDDLLDRVPNWFVENSGGRRQIMADLGRLLVARELLADGADQAIWFDADTLVFAPETMDLSLSEDPGYAFGREVWVQPAQDGRGLKAHRNIHNAVCLFRRDNVFLDFYIHACLVIMGRVSGGVPPQIIGPKFLTAQYNILGFPVFDTVGAFSPAVLRDIHRGAGPALDLLCRKSLTRPLAANLCASLSAEAPDMNAVCQQLLSQGPALFRQQS